MDILFDRQIVMTHGKISTDEYVLAVSLALLGKLRTVRPPPEAGSLENKCPDQRNATPLHELMDAAEYQKTSTG